LLLYLNPAPTLIVVMYDRRLPPALIPRLELLAAALLFSTGGAAIKLIHLTSWQIASFRSAIAAVALLILLPETRRGWTLAGWLAGVPYAGALVSFVVATKLTSAANAIFLQAAAPLYVMLLGPVFLKEHLRWRDFPFMAALAVGLILAFLGQPEHSAMAPNPALGNLLGTLSGVSWGVALIWLRKLTREGDASFGIRTALSGNVVTFLVCLPMALQGAAPTGWLDAVGLGYMGLFQVALAYTLLVRGISRVPAVESAGLLLAEPALNPVWAWVAAGERQPLPALAGGALILVSTLVNVILRSRRPS
jgi:drug/metabolite transporter, DME family